MSLSQDVKRRIGCKGLDDFGPRRKIWSYTALIGRITPITHDNASVNHPDMYEICNNAHPKNTSFNPISYPPCYAVAVTVDDDDS